MGIFRDTWKETILVVWAGFVGGILGSTITTVSTVPTQEAKTNFVWSIIIVFILTLIIVFITKNYKK
jgi:hypothetical protein